MKKAFFSLVISMALAGCSGGGNSDSTSVSPGTGTGGGNPPGNPGTENPPPYQARSWTPGFQLSNPNRQAHNPTVSVLSNGTVLAAWAEAATDDKPSAVFASVLRADLPEAERQRDALQISQLDDGIDSVLVNTRWNFTGEVERFTPSPQLAVSADGVGHVAWLQNDGVTTSVYVADYVPQGGSWSAAFSVESTDEPCSEIKLMALENGDAVLLWKQAGEDTIALKGVAYYANTGSWGAVFDVAGDVKADANVAIWERDGSVFVGYLASVDADNDRLSVANLDLTSLMATTKEVDSVGLKGSVVGTAFDGNDVLVWAELDEYSYYSVMAAASSGGEWQAVPQIEDLPYDVGHIVVSGIDDELHIAWRHKEQSSVAVFHGLKSVTYSATGISDVQTLFDSGAANPVLVNGGDGKMYAQWFTSHTKYSEYVPGEGWKSVTQPFCMPSAVISGSCFNSGTEHTLAVAGDYGVSAWLESVDDIRSVVISLSD